MINAEVSVLENIEDHSDILLPFIYKGSHGLNRCLGGLFIREVKFPGGNTAKSNALAAIFHSQLQTGAIAGGQFAAVLPCDRAIYDRAYCVQDIFARQIESRCDLCGSCRFLVPLRFLLLLTQKPKLYPPPGLFYIVDTRRESVETAK